MDDRFNAAAQRVIHARRTEREAFDQTQVANAALIGARDATIEAERELNNVVRDLVAELGGEAEGERSE